MERTWDAFDELIAEVEAMNAGWAEAREQRAREREAFGVLIEQIESHLRDFDPEGILEQVRERLLGGAGFVERVATLYNLDRLFLLRWPAAADPRPELAGVEGEYHIEVWLGLGEHFRPRVRVAGAKRLEANLPVTAEKFRAVLLGAVRSPAFAPHAAGTEENGEDAPVEEESEVTSAQPTAEAPEPGEAAEQTAGRETAEQEPAEPLAAQETEGREPADVEAQPQAEAQASGAEARTATPQPPDADKPIPMGPAAGTAGEGTASA